MVTVLGLQAGNTRPNGVVRTTASNRRAAVRDAERLVLGVVAPSGAVLRSSGTGIGPRAGRLTTASVAASAASAVAYRSWTVPEGSASTLSFVEAHLPAGSTVYSTGTGPDSESVIRAWSPVDGVLNARWLGIEVTSCASGGTPLYAESRSQWVVTRPLGERIPSGVREVDVTSRWPGIPLVISRRVTNQSKVRMLVALFDSLGILQPSGTEQQFVYSSPIVVIGFRAGAANRLVAEAGLNSVASISPPNSPITFSIRGRQATPLVGNVITPIERLMHVALAPAVPVAPCSSPTPPAHGVQLVLGPILPSPRIVVRRGATVEKTAERSSCTGSWAGKRKSLIQPKRQQAPAVQWRS